jgi:preprotein translocase subunit YajC
MQYLISALPFIAMIALFYLVVFLPERKRKKEYNQMIDSLKTGDTIVTRGGVIGKLVNVADDHIIVQSGPDRARLKLVKTSISHIVNEKEENK